MTGNPVALDTNQVILILNGAGDAGRWAASLWEMCLPVPVIGELRYGACNSSRPEANLHQVEAFVAKCRVLPADGITAKVYGDVRFALKKAGKPIPENDVWIAAICLQHEITLATADGHFSFVAGLSLMLRSV